MGEAMGLKLVPMTSTSWDRVHMATTRSLIPCARARIPARTSLLMAGVEGAAAERLRLEYGAKLEEA